MLIFIFLLLFFWVAFTKVIINVLVNFPQNVVHSACSYLRIPVCSVSSSGTAC